MNVSILRRALSVICCVFALITGAAAQTTTKSGDAKPSGGGTAFVEESAKLETPQINLYGTLLIPKTERKVPVVLIIAGSGPTDRDGNSLLTKGTNNSLKLLAEGLASKGIASLRYDKRGVGESGKEMTIAAQKTGRTLREDDLLFDAYVDDAAFWGQKLRGDKRFSAVVIAGHSEGSLIGMVAARKINADAFISISGAGRPAGQIILEQLRAQLPPELIRSAEDIVNQLASGKTVESVPPELSVLFRPSVQTYMISWLRFDPVKEIAKLTAPVLIIQGTTDMQVTARDAELLAGATPSAKMSLINGMNHVLKAVSTDVVQQELSYNDPSIPIIPELIDEISSFVNNTKK